MQSGRSNGQFPSRYQPITTHAPPLLVADQDGTIHAVNVQPLEGQGLRRAVFYRRWTLEAGWSRPNDILLSGPDGNLRVLGMRLDRNGYLHLIYYAGGEGRESVLHTQAPAINAEDARVWSPPLVLGENAGPLASGGMTATDEGEFTVVYTGRLLGIGLYEVKSTDFGNTWSSPQIVDLVYQANNWPTAVQLIQDESQELHLAWSVVNERGNGEGVYYARRSPQGWTAPYMLAERNETDYSVTWPSLQMNSDGRLIVIYQDDFPATRWMRLSDDAGTTWSEPIRPFPHEGEYEFARFATDSAGILHLFLGNRIGNPADHGMWHSTWQGNGWSPLRPVTSGPRTDDYDPSAPEVAIVQGNVILLTWWHNVPTAESAWFTYGILDSPALERRPLPVPERTPTPVQESAFSSNVATSPPALPTPVPIVPSGFRANDHPIENQTTGRWLINTVGPALLLMAGFVILRFLQLRNR